MTDEGTERFSYSEWVRDSVIDCVRSGQTKIARSGGWVAERRDKINEIHVSRIEEVINLDESDSDE